MAGQHGFELCRFARPEIPPGRKAAYGQWIQTGMHGDMAWMAERERVRQRKHPESMLAGVATVISLGMRHSPPPYTFAEAEKIQGGGVIAAYAHGGDYHRIMKKLLKALAHALDTLLGRHGQRIYVDTAPVLEHALAEASGLGWQGKHSLTINKGLGSWLMLGEIFTTAEIKPDPPAASHCGTCVACMSICPTNAIVAPYIVDARLCISYLTIEFDGFVPRKLRPLIGNRIFGCDGCQMVCPWNRHACAPDPDLLAPREENVRPELTDLLRLDDEAFQRRFRKSPVMRTGRGGLLRNVCIAMGNSGDADYVPVLLGALTDTEALVRGHAAWALGRLASRDNHGQIGAALKQIKQHENNENTLEEISISIQKIEACYDQA